MTSERLVSPTESGYFGAGSVGSVPTGDMPLFIGSTVRGAVHPELLRRALAELAATHPLLRSRVRTDGPARFVRDDTLRPRLEVGAGGAAAYAKLVNTRPDWQDALFHAHLLRADDHDQVVLVLHHGIADGRSAFALLAELWQRYTALHDGSLRSYSALPQPDSGELPEAVDTRLAAALTDAQVDGWLDQVRAAVATMRPESAPRSLPCDGAPGDPRGRFVTDRIVLDPAATADLVAAARGAGLSVNSLLTGAALIAFRSLLEPEAGALPVFCGHAVDLRGELRPPPSERVVLNCVSGVGTGTAVAPDADLFDLGRDVAAGMRAAAQRREAALFLLASPRADAVTRAVLTAPPSFAISNIGRVPAHSLPGELSFIRADICAIGPGMPPKFTVFTIADQLTVQVEYDTTRYSPAVMARMAEVFTAALRRTRAAAYR
ncbi:hypothetical protein ACFVMC_24065 [Nocardia sp. NPDC127579]|uniref:phthiocerol/phthiodiolone dimycocerosyl transferase family protein n=1 Tax=Nocardia sp. NPDC127579 TaxID=3345402 RepID=UPI0036252F13